MKKYSIAVIAFAVATMGCTDQVKFSSLTLKKTMDGEYIDPDTPPVVPPVHDDDSPAEPPVVVEPVPPVPPVTPTEPTPVEPPVVVTPIPSPTESNGVCPAGLDGHGRVTACLSCPPAPQPQWELSGKAKRLLDTMDRACRIANKSAPKNYVPPTREELIQRLRACSPEVYPDTELTKEETAVIPRLAAGDKGLLNRMFSGLWYQPPYSDAFDHYFGLGVEEAVPLLCFKTQAALEGELWSREMWNTSIDNPFVWQWPRELQELHAYYQHVRSGLKKCLDKAGFGGPSGPIEEGQTAKNCSIKAYQGLNSDELRGRAAELLANGYTVSLESSVACLELTDANLSDEHTGSLKIAGLKCE